MASVIVPRFSGIRNSLCQIHTAAFVICFLYYGRKQGLTFHMKFESKKEGKDQESMQSSFTPDLRQHMGK